MKKFSSFVPLMHEWEYKFIEKYLLPSDILLEWGCGNSTLYYSDFVSKVISIEHDVSYFTQVSNCIKAFNAKNIDLHYVPPTIKDQSIKRYDQLKDYIEFPIKQKFNFNRILIDGRARKECAVFISQFLTADDVVFIHDFNHNNVEGYVDTNYFNDILEKYEIIEFEKRGQGIVALKRNFKEIKTFNTRQDFFKTFSKNLNICEIGVFQGEFSKFIHKELEPKELVLIDLFDGNTSSADQNFENNKFANLNEEYKNLVTYFDNKNVKLIKGKSQEKLKELPDNYFDIIYVDGDHSYDGVIKDLKNAYLKTKQNGVICGHDYNLKYFPHVVAAVSDFCNEYKLKIDFLTLDKLPTFGIIKI